MPHLTEEDLVSYRDGELEEPRRRAASVHLESCERCRAELTRFEEDLRLFRRQDPTTYSVDVIPPSERLAELERSLRVWSSGQVRSPGEKLEQPSFPPPEIVVQMQRQLGPTSAAEALALIGSSGADRARLVSSLGDLLVSRLGEARAAELLKTILAAWDQQRDSLPRDPSR